MEETSSSSDQMEVFQVCLRYCSRSWRSIPAVLQVQQPPEFLSVMLRQWHVIRSRPRQSISDPGHGFTCVHRLSV